jgi:hypothetical protein
LEPGDRIHDLLTEPAINLPIWALAIRVGEAERFANHDCDGTKPQTAAATRQSGVGTKNSHRDDGCECLCNHEPDTRFGRLQVPVGTARTLRENEDAVILAEGADERFQRGQVVPFLIDGDDVEFREKPAEEWLIE